MKYDIQSDTQIGMLPLKNDSFFFVIELLKQPAYKTPLHNVTAICE